MDVANIKCKYQVLFVSEPFAGGTNNYVVEWAKTKWSTWARFDSLTESSSTLIFVRRSWILSEIFVNRKLNMDHNDLVLLAVYEVSKTLSPLRGRIRLLCGTKLNLQYECLHMYMHMHLNNSALSTSSTPYTLWHNQHLLSHFISIFHTTDNIHVNNYMLPWVWEFSFIKSRKRS